MCDNKLVFEIAAKIIFVIKNYLTLIKWKLRKDSFMHKVPLFSCLNIVVAKST